MKKENILNEVIKKGIVNGGFTIDKDLQDIKEKNGFMVSIIDKEIKYDLKNYDIEVLKKDILSYIDFISKYKNNYYVGLWIDNNTIYLDISKHFKNKTRAMDFGIINNQQAIYNIATGDSIYLTKKIYILYEVDKIKNDIKYLFEVDKIENICKYFNTKIENIYQYITCDIENTKSFINGKYMIFEDNINIAEL